MTPPSFLNQTKSMAGTNRFAPTTDIVSKMVSATTSPLSSVSNSNAINVTFLPNFNTRIYTISKLFINFATSIH